MAGPLDGYTVLDLSSGVAGPMAGMFFADYGADVVKIEPPRGDPLRGRLPGYHVWNRGKRSLTLDLKTIAGRKILTRLLRDADVLIESFGAGVSEKLGVDYPALSARFPRLIYCSISGYGDPTLDREHVGFEALVHARSGLCNEQPGFRPGPNFCYFPTASYGAGILIAIGAMAALYRRGNTGEGQHVRTSLMDGALAALALQLAWARTPTPNLATPSSSSPPGYGAPTVDAYLCADGRYLYIHTGAKGSFERLCQLIGCKAEDFPGYYPAHFVHDPDQGHRFRMLVINAFLAKPMAEMAADLQRQEIAMGPCLAPGEILRHEQAAANQLAIELDDHELGPIIQVGLPIKFQATPGAIRSPAPLPGQDNTEMLGGLGFEDQPTGERKPGPDSAGAGMGLVLEGVKVLDLGNFIAGPAACLPLADLGAEVIKLEPLGGDPIRSLERVFVGAQRGRRSIAVDLKRPEGLEIARKLAARADVIEHNFRPGVADRLGLGYEDIRRLNPAVIYCHVTAFGSCGPLAQAPGFETITRAWSGIDTSSAGEGNPPLKLAGSPIDMFSGLLAALGVMMALDYRRRTGQGQFLEMPQLALGMLFQSQAFLTRDGLVPQFKLDRKRTGFGPFYRLYETPSGWVCVCCSDQSTEQKMLRVMNLEPAPGRFAGRGPDQELVSALEQKFLEREASEWTRILRDAGVAIELVRVAPAADVLQNPQALRDGTVAEFPHPVYGSLRVVGNLIRLSPGSADLNNLPPPLVGQHTTEILDALGYSSAETAALERAGVVAQAPGQPATIERR